VFLEGVSAIQSSLILKKLIYPFKRRA